MIARPRWCHSHSLALGRRSNDLPRHLRPFAHAEPALWRPCVRSILRVLGGCSRRRTPTTHFNAQGLPQRHAHPNSYSPAQRWFLLIAARPALGHRDCHGFGVGVAAEAVRNAGPGKALRLVSMPAAKLRCAAAPYRESVCGVVVRRLAIEAGSTQAVALLGRAGNSVSKPLARRARRGSLKHFVDAAASGAVERFLSDFVSKMIGKEWPSKYITVRAASFQQPARAL